MLKKFGFGPRTVKSGFDGNNDDEKRQAAEAAAIHTTLHNSWSRFNELWMIGGVLLLISITAMALTMQSYKDGTGSDDKLFWPSVALYILSGVAFSASSMYLGYYVYYNHIQPETKLQNMFDTKWGLGFLFVVSLTLVGGVILMFITAFTRSDFTNSQMGGLVVGFLFLLYVGVFACTILLYAATKYCHARMQKQAQQQS